jgi:preprotein translocase subunit SecE
MATEEDLKKAEAEEESQEDEPEAKQSATAEKAELRAKHDADEDKSTPEERTSEEAEEAEEADGAPVQLGYQRYVYAAYMAGAMLVAFLAAKIGHAAWYRLGQWKPELGEPNDELVYSVAGVVGVIVAVYYWRKPEARQYANEVAEELSKVTWPSRKEVTSSTTVVVLTTVFATVFFALMDRFWGFITDKIYTF